MTSEDMARFLREFGPRRDAMLRRLHKAAGVHKAKPMNLADLEVLAAATVELLTNTLANMPEPRRGEVVRGLPGRWKLTLPKSASGLDRGFRFGDWMNQRVQRDTAPLPAALVG